MITNHQAKCDKCGKCINFNGWVSFRDAARAIRDMGWRTTRRLSGEWGHYCGVCRKKLFKPKKKPVTQWWAV